MLEIFGYIGAALMGLSLGLIGGGGSILTVPILVFLFGLPAEIATAYSLFTVGLTSLVGSLSHIRLGNIHWRTALVFGVPAIITVFATRRFVMPAIPHVLFRLGDFDFTKDIFLLLVFAVLMVLAAGSMIRQRQLRPSNEVGQFPYFLILAEGLVVGCVTGLVGAGGGFLIIPALVILAKLPMKQAVGTSLIIIAAKSLIGFLGDVHADLAVDWVFLLTFSAIAILGIIA
ncbi:MAG: sulfite exporter TauE/SafE family protein, partial [Saprospiraceae bacterium]